MKEDPIILSNEETKEIERILSVKKLNVLFAIDTNGETKRFYSSHINLNTIQDENETTSLLINTKIPKSEINEEPNFLKFKVNTLRAHIGVCPCPLVGGKCDC